jgi:hypothetical protein
MSFKYMNRVWELETLKGGRLLLMLAIADHANDAGECWPSQRHLAKKARLNERQVRRVVDSLIASGYLSVSEKIVEHKKRLVYRLFPPAGYQPLELKQPDKMSAKVAGKMSGDLRTFLPDNSGHFGQPRADISDAVQSHAGSESPNKPKAKPSIEPTNLSLSESWAACMAELISEHTRFADWLPGSTLAATDTVREGRPVYQLAVANPRGLEWLESMSNGIRRKIGTFVGKRIELQIVAAPPPPHAPPPPTPGGQAQAR